MKILHVCNHFHPCLGGIERYVDGLCKNLIELGHISDVLCLNTCAYSKEKFPELGRYKGIEIHRVSYINLNIYKIAPSILKFLRGYDIIHVHGVGFFSDFLALTKFIHKKPLILSTHGGIFHTREYHKLKMIYFEYWCRFALKKFDGVIAVSKNDACLFSEIVPNIIFIPNAIEIEDFESLMRKPEKNSFLYVGRISRNKRIDDLINTFYFLKKKVPDIKLYVIGDDWEGIGKDLEGLVKEKGLAENVIFIGVVADQGELLDYFSRAQFFVSASEYEGFGISVIEAMGAGVSVILNDISAFRNLVNNGKDGFIVDFSSHEESANTILKLMLKDMCDIGEKAKVSARNYDIKKRIKEIERVYKTAILGD